MYFGAAGSALLENESETPRDTRYGGVSRLTRRVAVTISTEIKPFFRRLRIGSNLSMIEGALQRAGGALFKQVARKLPGTSGDRLKG